MIVIVNVAREVLRRSRGEKQEVDTLVDVKWEREGKKKCGIAVSGSEERTWESRALPAARQPITIPPRLPARSVVFPCGALY